MSPQRIQRLRTKGWRMPEGAIYVGRPSKWGNPFKGEVGAATMTRQMLADQFEHWITRPVRWWHDGIARSYSGCPHFLGVPYQDRPTVYEIAGDLAGRDLACWCPLDQPCHADVLLEIANGTE